LAKAGPGFARSSTKCSASLSNDYDIMMTTQNNVYKWHSADIVNHQCVQLVEVMFLLVSLSLSVCLSVSLS